MEKQSTPDSPPSNPQLQEIKTNKKIKMTKRKEERKYYKFCWELGDGFQGLVFGFTGQEAWDIANKILSLPVPKQVRKRLVYFCDASIRSMRGAAGVVWPERYPSTEWQGKGVYYPLRTDDSATLELFAISCALRTAIEEIDKEHASVVENIPVDEEFFQSSSLRTESHLHSMTKELFVFTDDINALRRIDGGLPYPPNGQMTSQVASISRYSRTLNTLGVHMELHLSPGHCRLPGNVAADAMAKRAQRQLVRETVLYRPVAE